MEATTEPPMKKIKMESATETLDSIINSLTESKKNLNAVLSQDLYNEIPKIKMYAGQIKDPKELSKAIQILNEKLPLKTLQHLKRVRKKDVLLFKSSELDSTLSIQEFIDSIVPELSSSFEYFKEIDVPAIQPKLKRQSVEANKIWSCNFHPNLYLEKLANNKFFNESELEINKTCMRMAFETARWHLQQDPNPNNNLELNACVVFDPSIQSVVAVSFDNREKHPVQHSAMIAIDNVAKTQHGGAWTMDNKQNIRFSGIDNELLEFLKEKFKNINFGAKIFRLKTDVSDDDTYGPYLCTGYYIYMIREPCLMCAMGLVHARVKRVFFCLDNPSYGALKSKTELQSVPFLNHHFEVFTGYL